MTKILEPRCLGVFLPVFNEIDTIRQCLDLVLANDCVGEVVVVDDCSTDGTSEFLRDFGDPRVRVFNHKKNMGKGAALRTALPYITTPYFIIQDADLEYDPREYSKILKPLIENRADVVYGSRFVGGGDRRVLRFWHSMGNKLLTFISNCFTNLYLTDMATCYKCFRTEIIKSLNLRENRFGIDPEITAKIAKEKIRIVEVGISYTGRSYDEGKKIGIRDGFRHIFCMIVYRFRK